VVRVVLLAMLTHHLGDVAAGGIFHSLSGLILFLPAFALTVGLDGLLRRWGGAPLAMAPLPGTAGRPSASTLVAGMPRRSALAVGVAAAISVCVTVLITPAFQAAWSVPPGLAQAIPMRLGPWEMVDVAVTMNTSLSLPGARTEGQPYDEVVLRTYQNPQGQQVMLAVAYAYQLQQSVKIHRPEVCYAAQGYDVQGLTPVTLHMVGDAPGVAFDAKRMVATKRGLNEQVLYWIRVGPQHSDSAFRSRWLILSRGLRGQATDGILVRVSAIRQPDERQAEVDQRLVDFVNDLHRATGQASSAGRSAADLLW
jgi:EpsI family protein